MAILEEALTAPPPPPYERFFDLQTWGPLTYSMKASEVFKAPPKNVTRFGLRPFEESVRNAMSGQLAGIQLPEGLSIDELALKPGTLVLYDVRSLWFYKTYVEASSDEVGPGFPGHKAFLSDCEPLGLIDFTNRNNSSLSTGNKIVPGRIDITKTKGIAEDCQPAKSLRYKREAWFAIALPNQLYDDGKNRALAWFTYNHSDPNLSVRQHSDRFRGSSFLYNSQGIVSGTTESFENSSPYRVIEKIESAVIFPDTADLWRARYDAQTHRKAGFLRSAVFGREATSRRFHRQSAAKH